MSVNATSSSANQLWLYYKRCYGPSGECLEKVECESCSKHFAYKSKDYHGSLWRHLRNAHGIEREGSNYTARSSETPTVKKIVIKNVAPERDIFKAPAERKSESQAVKKKVVRTATPATRREILMTPAETIDAANVSVYRYFTLYKGGKAKCRVCMSAGLPTPLLTSNVKDMLSHLKTHPRAYKLYELEEEYGKSGPEFDEHIHMPDKTSTSGIFAQASDGKYYCQFCQTTLTEAMEMQKHLKEQHAITEQDIGNDVIYTEVIFVGDKDKNTTVTKQKKTSKPVKESKNLENQDVDAFGKYVTTLLKSMPKEDSTKLQQTILNNIIETKLKASRESSKNQETVYITEEESEEQNIAVITSNDDDNDYIYTGDNIEEVSMMEEHLEHIEEDVEDIEELS